MNEGIQKKGTELPSEDLILLSGKLIKKANIRIAEAEAPEEYWKHEATHDELTGLLNRKGFMNEAKDILEQHPNPENLALLVFDLDKLKSLNDRFGHNGGDAGIRTAGQFLKKHFRASDTVSRNITGRVGGDEFYAILDLTPRDSEQVVVPESKEQKLQKLLDIQGRMEKDFTKEVTQNDPRFIESGFGISGGGVLYAEGTSIEDWIKEADALMYKQKQARGNARR